ncbi:hypothetical protein INR49_018168 [Caranx melampygus]|nr:hypothetical protein INR49_018168 [Caranx melampygus]
MTIGMKIFPQALHGVPSRTLQNGAKCMQVVHLCFCFFLYMHIICCIGLQSFQFPLLWSFAEFCSLVLILLIFSQVHSRVLLFLLCFLFACHPSFWHTQVMTVKGSSILRHTRSSSHSPPGLNA